MPIDWKAAHQDWEAKQARMREYMRMPCGPLKGQPVAEIQGEPGHHLVLAFCCHEWHDCSRWEDQEIRAMLRCEYLGHPFCDLPMYYYDELGNTADSGSPAFRLYHLLPKEDRTGIPLCGVDY